LEESSQLKRKIYKDDQKIKNLKQIVIRDLKAKLSSRVSYFAILERRSENGERNADQHQ
jgi:hypothetical protein